MCWVMPPSGTESPCPADVICCEDTRRTGRLLQLAGIERSAKLLRVDDHTEAQRVPEVLDRLQRGERVVVVTDAGTPGISDPGFLLVREAIAAGIDVVPLPGATAFVPALVASGLPCDRFVFEGFLPQKKGRQTRLRALADEPRTMVLYESPHRLPRLLRELAEHLGDDRPAAVARELTKIHEEFRRGTLAELAAEFESRERVRGEIVIVVGGR